MEWKHLGARPKNAKRSLDALREAVELPREPRERKSRQQNYPLTRRLCNVLNAVVRWHEFDLVTCEMKISLSLDLAVSAKSESISPSPAIYLAACLPEMLGMRTSIRCSVNLFQSAVMVLRADRVGSRQQFD